MKNIQSVQRLNRAIAWSGPEEARLEAFDGCVDVLRQREQIAKLVAILRLVTENARFNQPGDEPFMFFSAFFGKLSSHREHLFRMQRSKLRTGRDANSH